MYKKRPRRGATCYGWEKGLGMSDLVLVRGARQLLTLHGPCEPRRGSALGELGLIRDGALLLEDGRIVEVGLSRRVENLVRARKAREIDATGRVVMPGFVDCHTHLISGTPQLEDYETRAAGAGTPAPAGLACNAVRQWSARRLEVRARQFVSGMVRHGTTTLEAKSGYGLDETGELKILRVQAKLHEKPLDVVSTFLCPRSVPAAYQGGAEAYLSWICSELLPKIRSKGSAHFVDFVCDEPAFSPAQSRQYLETARALGFPLKVHAGQFGGHAGVQLAVDQNAVSADHLNYADRNDVELLARSSTVAVLMPGSPFYLGCDRYPPARALIDEGAAVALATNFNPRTCPTYSMQMVLALACTRMRMRPAEALCAATFNAACAIGCQRRAGSLEVGKAGDLIVLNAADYREIPYHFGVNLVRMTVKRGAIVYQEGAVCGPAAYRGFRSQ